VILAQAGLTLEDIDVFEIHEAFAAQVLATIKCLASAEFAREFLGRTDGSCVGVVPLERVNPNGSSIAIGHPFAVSDDDDSL
jgi:acetyl-CoA acetyltransferase